MSSPSSWAELIPRLEKDLRSRKHGGADTDEAAWHSAEQLLRDHAKMLGRAYPMVSKQDLEDVVQNVLVKLQSTETLARVRISGSPVGYMVVTVRNTILDLLRHNRKESETYPGAEDADLAEPEHARVGMGSHEVLQQALASLSSDDRVLLTMRFWQGMSVKEAADALNISYSAAAVRSFRALKRLREMFRESPKVLPHN